MTTSIAVLADQRFLYSGSDASGGVIKGAKRNGQRKILSDVLAQLIFFATRRSSACKATLFPSNGALHESPTNGSSGGDQTTVDYEQSVFVHEILRAIGKS